MRHPPFPRVLTALTAGMVLLSAPMARPAAAQDAGANTAIEAGQKVWAKCQACHTITPGGRNTVGPNLHGVVGRAAGSVPGYRYSPALANSGIVWTEEMLDKFIADSTGTVPGTKMYGGLTNAEDRANLIAWMKRQ